MMDKISNNPVESERDVNIEEKLPASTSKDTMECRSCLAGVQKDACVDVFCAWNPPWPGMGLSMAEDMAKLAGIQISVSDPHSKIICKTCCNMLQNAISFMLSVQNSDFILRKRLKHSSTEESSWPKPIQVDKNIANDALQDMEMEIENIKQEVVSEDEFDNDACNDTPDTRFETFDIKIEPEEMTQQHIVIDNNLIIPPPEENQTSIPNGDAETHAESRELQDVKEEPLSDDEIEAAPDIEKDCMLCMKAFHTVRGLKAHVIAVHSYDCVRTPPKPPVNRMIECPICNRCFETRMQLYVHETCHSKFACYVCDKKFDSFHQLSTHRNKHCKKRSVLPRLKTLDDVRRIAGHGGTKTLQIFDMKIPISRIRELQIDEKDPGVKEENGNKIQKAGGKDKNDILGNILNENVMSVIVNVRLPCENIVQPKKEQNYDKNPIEEQIDDIEMLIPKIELTEEPDFSKKIAGRSKRKKQSKSFNPRTLPTSTSREIIDQETPSLKLPKKIKEFQAFLKKSRKMKREQQSENQDLDDLMTATKILKEEQEIKEKTKIEDKKRIIRMKNNGIGWTIKDGRVVAKKKVDPLYPCRKKCTLNIPEEFRQRFFDYFWSLSYRQQQNFAASLIKCKFLDKIPDLAGIGPRDRKCTFSYRLKLDKEGYDICKGCLIQTIGVQSSNYLINICNKALKKKMRVTTASNKQNKKFNRLKLLESTKILPLVAASTNENQKVQ